MRSLPRTSRYFYFTAVTFDTMTQAHLEDTDFYHKSKVTDSDITTDHCSPHSRTESHGATACTKELNQLLTFVSDSVVKYMQDTNKLVCFSLILLLDVMSVL